MITNRLNLIEEVVPDSIGLETVFGGWAGFYCEGRLAKKLSAAG